MRFPGRLILRDIKKSCSAEIDWKYRWARSHLKCLWEDKFRIAIKSIIFFTFFGCVRTTFYGFIIFLWFLKDLPWKKNQLLDNWLSLFFLETTFWWKSGYKKLFVCIQIFADFGRPNRLRQVQLADLSHRPSPILRSDLFICGSFVRARTPSPRRQPLTLLLFLSELIESYVTKTH